MAQPKPNFLLKRLTRPPVSTITCACGNVIETGSTKKDIKVEVCSKCHPFYTGKQKMVDTGGRVSRFNKKFGLG